MNFLKKIILVALHGHETAFVQALLIRPRKKNNIVEILADCAPDPELDVPPPMTQDALLGQPTDFAATRSTPPLKKLNSVVMLVDWDLARAGHLGAPTLIRGMPKIFYF